MTARRVKRQRATKSAKGPGFVESGLITELPSDTMKLILEKLDSPKDIAALLMASKSFQQSTMAALPPQQRLWYGARLGQLQHVESALKEGARVNKLDPTGHNALMTFRLNITPSKGLWKRITSPAYQQVKEFLISKGAKAFDQKSLNEELCDIIYTDPGLGRFVPMVADPPSALLRVKEAILDGADMHARLQYGKYQPYSSALGNMAPTMEKMDIMRFAICKAKLEPSVYIPWIKTLLECGYDVNKSAQDSTFSIARITTPLMDAIDVKRTGPFYVDLDEVLNPVAQYQPGGDSFTNFNATDRVRRRDLYFANLDTSEVVGSRIEILKVLLNAPNADVNKLNNGFTVLHYLQLPSNGHDHSSFPMDDGLRQENIAIARLLLQAGADVSIRAEDSAVDMAGTAVDMAECNLQGDATLQPDEYEIWTEYLQTMLNVLKGAEEARDGFIDAVKENDVDSVQQHIARGAPVNTMFVPPPWPTTPLHLAIYNCDVIYCGPGVLKALLAAPNINVNVQAYFVHGGRRGTPLHYAVEINEVECVRALLAAPGVDVNAKTDDDGITPLHLAVEEKHDDVMMALLSAPNIDVNIRSDKGETALQLAHENGRVEVVRTLLSWLDKHPGVTPDGWQCRLALTVPTDIGRLSVLTHLDLSHFVLTSVPADIGHLTSLEKLYLDGNQLTSLPAEIWQLTALRQLYICENQLTSVPAEIGQLTSLEELGLISNQLTSVPAEIWQLTSLRVLGLSRNELRSLPAEIGQLTSLEELYLGHNQLTSVPAEIGKLTLLRDLMLEGNQLTIERLITENPEIVRLITENKCTV